MSKEYWDKNDESNLVRFVNFAKESEAVQQFLTQAKKNGYLSASGYDDSPEQGEPRELIEKIYNALCQQKIEYELNEYINSWNYNQQQKIRTAKDILQTQNKGTCLDLAILFCAICICFDLLPILILLDGHALAAVSLTHSYRYWEKESRSGQELFWENLGILKDRDELIDLLDTEEYLPVECTGFAHSETLSENEEFTREGGLLLFKQAIDLGEQQVKQKKFIFALDVSIAYNFWLPRVFRERLNQEVPKNFNNMKNLVDEIYVPSRLTECNEDAENEVREDSIHPIDRVIENTFSIENQKQRLLIVGDPGSGKSTLLQKIADWVITNNLGLPIFISLAKFNKKLVEDKDVGDPGWLYRYLSEQWLRNLSKKGNKAPEKWQDLFEKLYESRQIWLLLDGADEMGVRYPLKKIQEQLAKGWSESLKVIVSCRLNLWEQQQDDSLKLIFNIYRVLDFDYPEQVHQFINNWFGRDDHKATKLKQELKKSENVERLQSLVKNPLQLALLCRIWNQGLGTLPDKKADLYQLLVDNYYQWKNDINDEFEIPSNTRRELNIALGKLAKKAIDNSESESKFRMGQNFIKNDLGDVALKDSLFSWALKLGWLISTEYPVSEENNLHEKYYTFPHPTFQEYFAALAIDNWQFLLQAESFDDLKNYLYKWDKVIEFWIGRKEEALESQQANFFKVLLEYVYKNQLDKSEISAQDEDEDEDKHKMFILMGFIQEYVRENKKIGIPALANYIDCMILEYAPFDYYLENWISYSFEEIAIFFGEIASKEERAIATLIKLLENKNHLKYVSREAIKSLVGISDKNKQVISIFIDSVVNNIEVNSVSQLHSGWDVSIVLEGFLKNDEKTMIKYANALINHFDYSIQDEEKLDYILIKLDEVFAHPDCNLHEVNIEKKKFVIYLKNLLNSTQNISFKSTIISLLFLFEDKDIVDYTLSLLFVGQDRDFLNSAIKNLSKSKYNREKIIDAFINIVNDSRYPNRFREDTVYSSAKIGVNSIKLIDNFAALIDNQVDDEFLLTALALSLNKVDDYNNKKAIQTLFSVLNSDIPGGLVDMIVRNLQKSKTDKNKLIAKLAKIIETNPNNGGANLSLSKYIVELAKNEIGNRQVIDILVNLLNYSEHIDKFSVIDAIGEIGIGDETAIRALTSLRETNNDKYRPNIDEALNKIQSNK